MVARSSNYDVPLTPEQKILVSENVNLAHRAVHDAEKRVDNNFDLEELVAIAYQGLMRAAQDYDPATGNKFSTFAIHKIRSAIWDWQRHIDHVPRRQRSSYKELQEHGHGTGQTPEQLADITGMSVDKIRAITAAVEHMSYSLSNHLEDDYDSESGRDLPAHHDVESSALEDTFQSATVSALGQMTELERNVYILRNVEGLEFTMIAEMLQQRRADVKFAHDSAALIIYEIGLKFFS